MLLQPLRRDTRARNQSDDGTTREMEEETPIA